MLRIYAALRRLSRPSKSASVPVAHPAPEFPHQPDVFAGSFLLVLWEQDDVLVKEIGQALFLDSGTLTPLLKRLESAGLLIRQRDAQDERQVRIVLTPEGKQLRKAAMAIPPQLVCASGQTLETLISLRQQLNDLREELHGESTDQIA